MSRYGMNDIKMSQLAYSSKQSDRMRAARWGYGLDKLVDDKSIAVRILVAKQRYGLDKLVKDENELVRAEVARQKYALRELMFDDSPMVRMAVAAQDFALDYFAREDEDEEVREFAREKIRERNRKEKSICDDILNNVEKYDFKTLNDNKNLENER